MDMLSILPRRVQRAMLPFEEKTEELRLRSGQAPAVLLPDGKTQLLNCAPVTSEELWRITEAAAGGSLYSCESQLCRGYLSLPGGGRLGICGSVNLEKGSIRSYSHISSLCVRFPHQAIGCAGEIWEEFREVCSVLIISPPGGGKTTLLRELVRLLSYSGCRVGLADERGEVAAMHAGMSQLDVGPNTDVISGALKSDGVMTLLRCMNPQVVALDEITQEEDASACFNAFGCGVRILATAHGESIADLRRRELYSGLLDRHVFEKCVVIHREKARRSYEVVTLD